MTEARNHHFVPQGYLRGFADGIGRKARVYVIDRVERKAFRTLVRNVGAQRDFNRIEVDELDPNALETAFGQFEGAASTALRRIAETGSFDQQDDRITVLNLVTLLAVRNPRLREQTSRFLGDIYRLKAELMASTKERWEAFRRQADADIGKDDIDVTYEEMRDFIKSDDYEIVPHQNAHAALELQSFDVVLRTLIARKWRLVIAKEDAGEFVTSDHPVSLFDISGNPSGFYGVGFGMAQTAVIFPVNRKSILYGTFEGEDKVQTVNWVTVAALNSDIILRAHRQVYAYSDRFRYLGAEGPSLGSRLVTDRLFLRDGTA